MSGESVALEVLTSSGPAGAALVVVAMLVRQWLGEVRRELESIRTHQRDGAIEAARLSARVEEQLREHAWRLDTLERRDQGKQRCLGAPPFAQRLRECFVPRGLHNVALAVRFHDLEPLEGHGTPRLEGIIDLLRAEQQLAGRTRDALARSHDGLVALDRLLGESHHPLAPIRGLRHA